MTRRSPEPPDPDVPPEPPRPWSRRSWSRQTAARQSAKPPRPYRFRRSAEAPHQLPRAAGERPLVFAHRGSSHAEPEHTIGAYLRAIEEGADGLECDVRLTRDGHLVCVHDGRLERTSNGYGAVSAHTLAELGELDFASWHPGPGEDDHLVYDRDHTVLTLDRLLAAAHDAGRPMRLLVETKHPSRYGPAVERRLVATLHRYGLLNPAPHAPVQVTVMSFSPLALRRVRRLAPRLPVVMLMEILPPGLPPPGLRTGRLPFGASIGGPGVALLRAYPEVAHRLHARGHRMYVWTVNEPADLDLALSLGAAGIITDRPAYIRRRMDDLLG